MYTKSAQSMQLSTLLFHKGVSLSGSSLEWVHASINITMSLQFCSRVIKLHTGVQDHINSDSRFMFR